MITANLNIIQKQLIDSLEKSEWKKYLYPFVAGREFLNILECLLTEANAGRRFTPKIKLLLKCFEECPQKDLKVVIIGQDPYFRINIADGLAFSCSNTMTLQKSLTYIYKEIQRTVYNNDYVSYNPDLKVWANQGVLLLNSAFTTQIDIAGTHYKIWESFLQFIIEVLNTMQPTVFILLGKKANSYRPFISENHYVLSTTHPAFAGYNQSNNWDCNDVFNKANVFLKERYNQTIKW